ncbi:MAG TPA: SDR family NAD(P)-dependent oxidoreductase, partial [Candidatus Limnocylindria bacterium]|nr:SDR family NAD(P)-dependent oxidoreductase [Candidatus Limnocylindria bacterium]
MDLTDRVAVITGATGDLGRVAARRLLDAGASLVLVGTARRRLEELAGTLPSADGRVKLVEADLTSEEGAASLAEALDNGPGRADLLLHGIGGWAGGESLLDVSLDTVRGMVDAHLWSTTYTVRAVVPRMVAGGWGRVVVVSTPGSARPGQGQAAYA